MNSRVVLSFLPFKLISQIARVTSIRSFGEFGYTVSPSSYAQCTPASWHRRSSVGVYQMPTRSSVFIGTIQPIKILIIKHKITVTKRIGNFHLISKEKARLVQQLSSTIAMCLVCTTYTHMRVLISFQVML